jgi:hypothetical protein
MREPRVETEALAPGEQCAPVVDAERDDATGEREAVEAGMALPHGARRDEDRNMTNGAGDVGDARPAVGRRHACARRPGPRRPRVVRGEARDRDEQGEDETGAGASDSAS